MKIYTHDAVSTREHKRALDYLVKLNPTNEWVSLRALTCWSKETNSPSLADESDIGVLFFQLSRGEYPVVKAKQMHGHYFYCLADDRCLQVEDTSAPEAPSLESAEALIKGFAQELTERKNRIQRRRARAGATSPSWRTPVESKTEVRLPDDF